jgi:TatA/E family protein of Tat protein translocase
MAFFSPGPWEIGILVVLILLILFGNRVPQLARNLGRSIVEFKSGLSGDKTDEKTGSKNEDNAKSS